MVDIPTAGAAANMAADAVSNVLSTELSLVRDAIVKSAKAGNREAIIYQYLHKATSKHLTEKGYALKPGSERNEYYTHITW